MVNRLIEPTAGRILLDGVDAAKRDVTELRREIGYVIQQIGLFPHQTIERERGHRPATARLAGGAPEGPLRGAAGHRRARPGASTRAAIPTPALRRRAAARRRRPGPRRGPADHAHGRAVRRRRPDRPRAAPERVPAPPGGPRQDDPVRDPRHRRGDQDGRPRRGHAGRRQAGPVRAAGGDPRQPRLGVRGPVRRARTAASSGCRSSGSTTCRCSPRRWRPSATTPASPSARPRPIRSRLPAPGRRSGPADRLARRRRLPLERAARPSRWPTRPRRCSTAGRPSRTRCRCCSTRTSRRASSSTGPARSRARHGRHDRRVDARPAHRAAATWPGRRRRTAPRTRRSDGLIPGSRSSTSAGSLDHMDDIALRDLCSTSCSRRSRVAIGFAIALVARDLGRPQAVALRPVTVVAGSCTRSRAWPRSRCSFPIFGLSLLTAVIPLDHVHAADPVPEHRRRLPRRPAGRPRGGRGDGLHAGATAAPRGAAARRAADDHRLAAGDVTTIGLATVASVLGATRSVASGSSSPRVSRRSSRRSTCSAPCCRSLLAFAADFLFVRARAARHAMGARDAAGAPADGRRHRLVHRPRQLAGDHRDPEPALRAPGDSRRSPS